MLTASMSKGTRALLQAAVLCVCCGGGLTAQTPAAGTADAYDADADTLLVDESGLPLYPRWNKLFPPVVTLDPGTKLLVVQDRGGWKHVSVDQTAERGWVFCLTRAPREGESTLSLPMAASPTT